MDYPYQQRPHQPYYLESQIDRRESTAQLKNAAYWHMDQVIGWCSHAKASILIDIIQKSGPMTIVEIGVWGGKSLFPMGYALKALGKGKIYGIDPWDSTASIEGMQSDANIGYWQAVDHEAVYQSVLQNVDRFQLGDHVEIIRSTSADAPPIPDIDILHIDGNHSSITSYLDVTKWGPLVKPGGWIIVDDISWYENGVFTQAESLKWLDAHCHRMAELMEGFYWGIWVKK